MPFGEINRRENKGLEKTQSYLNSFLQTQLDEDKRKVDKQMRLDAAQRVQALSNLLDKPTQGEVQTFIDAPTNNVFNTNRIPITQKVEAYKSLTDPDVMKNITENSAQNPHFDKYFDTYLKLRGEELDRREKMKPKENKFSIKEEVRQVGNKWRNYRNVFDENTGEVISETDLGEVQPKEFAPRYIPPKKLISDSPALYGNFQKAIQGANKTKKETENILSQKYGLNLAEMLKNPDKVGNIFSKFDDNDEDKYGETERDRVQDIWVKYLAARDQEQSIIKERQNIFGQGSNSSYNENNSETTLEELRSLENAGEYTDEELIKFAQEKGYRVK